MDLCLYMFDNPMVLSFLIGEWHLNCVRIWIPLMFVGYLAQGRRSSAASTSSFEQFVMRLNYRSSPPNTAPAASVPQDNNFNPSNYNPSGSAQRNGATAVAASTFEGASNTGTNRLSNNGLIHSNSGHTRVCHSDPSSNFVIILML